MSEKEIDLSTAWDIGCLAGLETAMGVLTQCGKLEEFKIILIGLIELRKKRLNDD